MTVEEPIEAEVVSERGLATVDPTAMALVSVEEMESILARGASQATVIQRMIETQHLATRIGGRSHIRFEGWVPIATANGKRLDTLDLKYEGSRGQPDFTAVACVGLRDMRSGEVVARAWASCSRRESNWKSRDDYAIESMAQTRAGGKICRMVYGWIVGLAGYEAAPAEEISEPSEAAPAERFAEKPADSPSPQKATDEPMTSETRAAIEKARSYANAVSIKAAQLRMKTWGYNTWAHFFESGSAPQGEEIVGVLSA